MSSRSKNDSDSLADALDSLAGLVRSGIPPRSALQIWHRHSPSEIAPSLAHLDRLLVLGLSSREALVSSGYEDGVLGETAGLLLPVFELHERYGGDLGRAIRGVAAAVRSRRNHSEEGRAAAAGAKVSGRVVASLPLLFVPVAPLGRAPLLDVAGITMLVVGVGLALCGMRWIARLTPSPPPPDDLDRFVSSSALLLRAGIPLKPALDAAAAPSSPSLAGAPEHVALGVSWGRALDRSPDPFLRRMASVVLRAERWGLPVAEALEDLVDQRREAAQRRFQSELRRAPVLMVVPLTLCVLPAFGLLALGPFLRSLALT